ncbi:nucleotide pyrophosphohydrolase [Vagococcus vulneris]|uniref:Nucleotide pyrophosphohydrolase n=1 Tax=Vagococcus vulneris TaxID=1977869 RepID=A0A429ZZB5_9ENTE|nr:nucleotide pyrophosphohydrolase [Vagococcus vulneris]RST99320.1 nucleotide pyrophosphohydrolase [Vagococcus vulneris]
MDKDEKQTLYEMQQEVDKYIQQFKTGYFPPLSQLARLTEEVGELAREVNHIYGDKKKKKDEPIKKMQEEIGDVLIVLIIMANSLSIDLSDAFHRNMEKFNTRDKFRFERKDEREHD